MTVNMQKVVAGAAMTGAIGLGVLGIGSGVAAAKPGNPGPPIPPIPGPVVPGLPGNWMAGMPPGLNPWGPPGQVMKMQTLHIPGGGEVTNPFFNVPPGHWGDLNYLNPAAITWLPPGFPDLTTPLNLVWNAAANAWGVFVNDMFIPYPIPLPAPMPVPGT